MAVGGSWRVEVVESTDKRQVTATLRRCFPANADPVGILEKRADLIQSTNSWMDLSCFILQTFGLTKIRAWDLGYADNIVITYVKRICESLKTPNQRRLC